jgi:uncharacterized protein with FMN-binding domain
MANKTSGKLVALGSAAVTAVYLTGYLATAGASASLDPTPVATPIVVTGTLQQTAAVVATATATPTPASVGTAVDEAPTASAGATSPAGPTAASPTNRPASSAAASPTASLPANPAGPSSATSPATGAAAGSPTATARPAATATPTTAAKSGYKDGTFTGAGTSRRGGFEVAVTVQGGRITNVALTRVTTQYPASRIAGLPAQVVARQSAQVDRVSGATYSVQAFQQAVQEALAQAAA